MYLGHRHIISIIALNHVQWFLIDWHSKILCSDCLLLKGILLSLDKKHLKITNIIIINNININIIKKINLMLSVEFHRVVFWDQFHLQYT